MWAKCKNKSVRRRTSQLIIWKLLRSASDHKCYINIKYYIGSRITNDLYVKMIVFSRVYISQSLGCGQLKDFWGSSMSRDHIKDAWYSTRSHDHLNDGSALVKAGLQKPRNAGVWNSSQKRHWQTILVIFALCRQIMYIKEKF